MHSIILILLSLLGIAAAQAAEKPLIYHLNGIGGERSIDHNLVGGLLAGGLEAEPKFHDWTAGQDGLVALQSRKLHEEQAKKVAEELAAEFKRHPGRPIHVTSHSGGAGIAVWALELLPDEVMIDSVLMISPALSPDYDLTRALKHVRGSVYVFSSPYDTIVLGRGTKLFGTIDGKKVEAAGLKGFVCPPGADEQQYKKLIAQPYQREWAKLYGNGGSHICGMQKTFARDYVAPLILGKLPTTRPVQSASTDKPAPASTATP